MTGVGVIKGASHEKLKKSKTTSQHNDAALRLKNTSNQPINDISQNETKQNASNPELKNAEKMAPKTEGAKELQTIRKCLRKGSRICYTDMENITVLRRIPEKEGSRISFAGYAEEEKLEKVDSYRSGESLFKTFTFEQTRDIDDPETVKCIEFWKSVMLKNLAPIKCTLLENNKVPVEKEKRKSISSLPKDKKEDKRKKSAEKPQTLNLTGDGAKIWSEALKEIRRKKLDQLKLYVRDRCQYCRDPFTSELQDDLGVETRQERESTILSLNQYKPNDEQIALLPSFSKPAVRSRISSKRKLVGSQTNETRMNEKSNASSRSRIRLSNQIEELNPSDPKQDPQEALKKQPSSILKSSSKILQQKSMTETSKKASASAVDVTSVEVQAPNVKCACESDTCVCPHRAAARNSRTSFVEVARIAMVHRDGSIEKFFPTQGKPCICEDFKREPWQKLTCLNDPCPAKQPKVIVEESCSDFDLSQILKPPEVVCLCSEKNLDVVCASANCRNKRSKGSLVEGFPEVTDPKKDPCACTTSLTDAACASNVCPSKIPEEKSNTCICSSSYPWSQTICKSWQCPNHRIKKRRTTDDEEKIKFKGHPPLKKITSTCICHEKIAWKDVTCHCEFCAVKSKPESILKLTEGKGSRSRNNLRAKLSNKDVIKNNPTSTESVHEERSKQKVQTEKGNKCACSVAPPWRTVNCAKNCGVKEEKRQSTISITSERVSKYEECVCKDQGVEPTCVYKCKNKEIDVDYPPPCICPEDLEETTQAFLCQSETCKMKKIDKTCLCREKPDSPCDNKQCVARPKGTKTLKKSTKPIQYDPQCICKVRGFPTTQDVNCTAAGCKFKTKPKVIKKKAPKLFVAPCEPKRGCEDSPSKCICDDAHSIKCNSPTCKMRIRSDQSGDTMESLDKDDSTIEECICKEKPTEVKHQKEVVCNTIECAKTSVGQNGAVMQDKCVCANLEHRCAQPSCPSAENEIQTRICSEIVQEKERPFCYICGHYDCAGNKKNAKVCNKKAL